MMDKKKKNPNNHGKYEKAWVQVNSRIWEGSREGLLNASQIDKKYGIRMFEEDKLKLTVGFVPSMYGFMPLFEEVTIEYMIWKGTLRNKRRKQQENE